MSSCGRANASSRSARLRSSTVVSASRSPKIDHVRSAATRWTHILRPTQQRWCNVPSLTRLRDDGDRLLVVARDHADDGWMLIGLERYAIPDLELQHPRMCSHFAKETEARNDAIVEVDELCFGKLVDVDLHRSSWPGVKGNAPLSCPTCQLSRARHRAPARAGC